MFSNTLCASFVWDDAAFVLENARLTSWSNLPHVFAESITSGAGIASGIYRPLQSVTHFVDLRLWGENPWGHHLTNVLLHAAATASVFYWLAGLATLPGAALAAALFSLHPLQSEAVAYISGRGDILAILFTCAGLTLFASRPRLAFACALAAMLSKENAVMFPVLLGLQTAASGRRFELRAQAPFWILCAVYAALHLLLFRFELPVGAHGTMAELAAQPLWRLYTYVTTLPMGLRLWLWPSDLHHERSWLMRTSFDGAVRWSFVGVALLFAAAVACRRRFPLISFGLAWFVVATLPTSNLLVVINALFYDHWFVFPGLGLALVVSQLVPKEARARNVVLLTGFALAAAFSLKTRALNAAWRDSYTLNSDILRYEPGNAKIRNNLGAALAAQGRWPEAAQELRAAIALDDVYAQAHHNLGKAYDAMNQEAAAAAEFQRAIDMDPSLYAPRICLGWIELRRGRTERAEQIFNDVLRLRVYAPSAWLGLAQIRLARGDRAGAAQKLQDGRRWSPDDPRLAKGLDDLAAGLPSDQIDRTWADSVR